MTTQLSFPLVGNPGKSKGYRFRTSRNDRTRYCRVKALEKRYRMTTSSFLEKFSKGEIGDEQDYFDWYAFHKFLSSWTNTKNALQPLIK